MELINFVISGDGFIAGIADAAAGLGPDFALSCAVSEKQQRTAVATNIIVRNAIFM
jgi:hypothetical protein